MTDATQRRDRRAALAALKTEAAAAPLLAREIEGGDLGIYNAATLRRVGQVPTSSRRPTRREAADALSVHGYHVIRFDPVHQNYALRRIEE